MPDETAAGSAGAPDGRGHPRGSPGEQSPLQARAAFLKNRSGELVVGLDRGACARGGAQHVPNSESYATLEAEWRRRQTEVSSLAEALNALRQCHRRKGQGRMANGEDRWPSFSIYRSLFSIAAGVGVDGVARESAAGVTQRKRSRVFRVDAENGTRDGRAPHPNLRTRDETEPGQD